MVAGANLLLSSCGICSEHPRCSVRSFDCLKMGATTLWFTRHKTTTSNCLRVNLDFELLDLPACICFVGFTCALYTWQLSQSRYCSDFADDHYNNVHIGFSINQFCRPHDPRTTAGQYSSETKSKYHGYICSDPWKQLLVLVPMCVCLPLEYLYEENLEYKVIDDISYFSFALLSVNLVLNPVIFPWKLPSGISQTWLNMCQFVNCFSKPQGGTVPSVAATLNKADVKITNASPDISIQANTYTWSMKLRE